MDGYDDGDDDQDGDDADDANDDPLAARRREELGSIFERYIYATRSLSTGAARALYGKAWYGIVKIESILYRAPLEVPFFASTDEAAAWARASEAKRCERQKAGCFLYNHFMPAH